MRCPVCSRDIEPSAMITRRGVVLCHDCAGMMKAAPASTPAPVATGPALASSMPDFDNMKTERIDIPDADALQAELRSVVRDVNAVLDEIAKRIIGQEEVLRLMLAVVISGGYCLLEGVPGLAKTAMVKALARTLDCSFKRIQFTPDLMPFDITGTEVVTESDGKRSFTFVKGPLFANVVLADEINRTPPKTQAALLEAMQERQVTVGNQTHPLPDPFFVIATRNPIEQEGTYELPEAQLDRFMFNVLVDYPTQAEEERILTDTARRVEAAIKPVLSAERIRRIQLVTSAVQVPPPVISYAARIIRSTRPADRSAPAFIKEVVDWGASPRAGQCLIAGARAVAAMEGRAAATPADVRRVAAPALRHRVITNFQAQAEGIDATQIVKKLIDGIPEPAGGKYG
jgi:MoxR-like ATPase